MEFFQMDGNLPDGLREVLQRHEDQAAMQREAAQQEIERFFNELAPEHLVTLRSILYTLSVNEEPRRLAGFYEGIAIGALKWKHNRCGVCGDDHDHFDLSKLNDAPPASEEESLASDHDNGTTSLFANLDEAAQTFEGKVSDELQEKMDEYNLDDLRDEDTNDIIGYVCKGCGLKYASVADRALRPAGPGGCDGCVQKTKWG
jgi:hypothetical protein